MTLKVISSFRYGDGTHTPLSNFYLHPIELGGYTWPSNEHYFQAMKANSPDGMHYVRGAATPGDAKKRGREVTLRHDWEAAKLGVMREALEAKFQPGQPLGDWLLQTLPAMLIEGNHWHDTFWGVCRCDRHDNTGDNWLGILLMARRAELRALLP